MIRSKSEYDEMIDELEKRFALPTDAQLTRPHPLPGGTPIYARFMDRLDPNKHARWLSGTVNSCVKKGDRHTYHILFDNEEEAHSVDENYVLHRLDYDKMEWPKSAAV